jgi:hypothetical protein
LQFNLGLQGEARPIARVDEHHLFDDDHIRRSAGNGKTSTPQEKPPPKPHIVHSLSAYVYQPCFSLLQAEEGDPFEDNALTGVL